ncbi:MAG: hypothetical protein AAF533_27415 [Acidobacteriota bacterium]
MRSNQDRLRLLRHDLLATSLLWLAVLSPAAADAREDRGACCVGPTCSLRTTPDCVSIGGIFAGVGTTCEDADCASLGACCLGDDCLDGVTELEWKETDGVFIGGAACEACTAPITTPLPPWAQGLLALAVATVGVLLLGWDGRLPR